MYVHMISWKTAILKQVNYTWVKQCEYFYSHSYQCTIWTRLRVWIQYYKLQSQAGYKRVIKQITDSENSTQAWLNQSSQTFIYSTNINQTIILMRSMVMPKKILHEISMLVCRLASIQNLNSVTVKN